MVHSTRARTRLRSRFAAILAIAFVLLTASAPQGTDARTRLRPLPNPAAAPVAAVRATVAPTAPAAGPWAGLDPQRQSLVAQFLVKYATGLVISGDEAQILTKFGSGQPVTELEADTLVSRALYTKYITRGRLNNRQSSLAAAFEATMVNAQAYRNASKRFAHQITEFTAEIEPNNTIGAASGSVSHRFNGALANDGSPDVDHYAVNVPAGATVAVSFNGDPLKTGTVVGAAVDLLDRSGAALPVAFRSATIEGSTVLPGQSAIFSVPVTGTYYVTVRSDVSVPLTTASGAYGLGVDLFAGTAAQSSGGARGGTVVNGGFETGDFTGWTTAVPCNLNTATWTVYSGAASAPISGTPLPAPPEGVFASVFDQNFNSTGLLYQDITLAAGQNHILTFTMYYNNQDGTFVTPDTLACDGETNQQIRVDILNTAAPVDSVAAGDVLLNVFRTEVGDPAVLGPSQFTADLSAFAGQTVRLRFADVDNLFFQTLVVDAVDVISFPQGVDLQVVKTAAPDPVPTASNLTYTILVANNSETPRTNVTLTDVVPTNTTFVSATAPAGWTCTTPPVGGTGTVTCTTPTLAAGAVAILNLVVAVGCVPVASDGLAFNITNTVTVTSTEPDADPSDNTATAVTGLVDPAPTVVCPAEGVTVPGNIATGCTITGAVVTFDSFISVVDNCPGSTVVCEPASGSTLPIGTTTVTCTATDISGNTGSCSFPVNVVQPATLCFVDDNSGDTFTQTVPENGGLVSGGLWTYTVAATGITYCGTPDQVAYTPGHSLIVRDTSDPLYSINANFTLRTNGAGTVTFIIRPGERHVLRDRNISNDPPCSAPPPPTR